jgi:hypothetical protein
MKPIEDGELEELADEMPLKFKGFCERLDTVLQQEHDAAKRVIILQLALEWAQLPETLRKW